MTKTKPPLKQVLDAKQCVLECVRWQDEQNRPMFAYVLMKKAQLPAFTKALREREVDLTKFGVVMAHGSGSKPPAELEQQVLEAIRKTA